jgi:hypothetical protein
MDALDALVLRKRRDRLMNPVTAPMVFLQEVMFNYAPPPPIPSATPQYVPPQQPQYIAAPAFRFEGVQPPSPSPTLSQYPPPTPESVADRLLARKRDIENVAVHSHNTRSKQRDHYF